MGAIRESIEKPAFRAAAASAVNVHPKAKTFEGLVPVSLDAPPSRPKRMGKQVSTVMSVVVRCFRCAIARCLHSPGRIGCQLNGGV